VFIVCVESEGGSFKQQNKNLFSRATEPSQRFVSEWQGRWALLQSHDGCRNPCKVSAMFVHFLTKIEMLNSFS